MRNLLAPLCLWMLGGCSTTIDADDYVRSCTATFECAVISVGEICDCACEYSAVNVVDYERYREDRGDIQCSKMCEPCPEAPDAICVAGLCEAP